MKGYIVRILLSLDQFLNTVIGGSVDESLSAHAWRMEHQGKPWGLLRPVIDSIFGEGHCERSFVAECERAQSPEEER